MLVVFLRALLLYFAVLLVIRLMGKRQIGQMQPFELVLTILIAELAASPMENPGVPLYYGIIPILTLFFAHEGITWLILRSERARGVVCGKPSVLIYKGQLVQHEIRKQRVDINDLLEQLRLKNILSVEDCAIAVVETSGELSAFPIAAEKSATAKMLQVEAEDDELSYTLILDGRVNAGNLRKAGINIQQLNGFLAGENVRSYREAFLVTVDGQRQFHLQKMTREAQS